MRTNYTASGDKKRKGKLIMAAVCGPVFTIGFFGFLFVLSFLSTDKWDGFQVLVWPALGGAAASAATLADRLGKRFKLTPQEFAAPVALSCTLCPILTFLLLWTLL